jgi:hypothetical protein
MRTASDRPKWDSSCSADTIIELNKSDHARGEPWRDAETVSILSLDELHQESFPMTSYHT